MNSEKLTGAIGLACRARALALGQTAAEDAMRRGRVGLLLLDPSISEGNRRQWEAMAESRRIPVLVLPEPGILARATGKENARTACVGDPNFIRLIRRAADAESRE